MMDSIYLGSGKLLMRCFSDKWSLDLQQVRQTWSKWKWNENIFKPLSEFNSFGNEFVSSDDNLLVTYVGNVNKWLSKACFF